MRGSGRAARCWRTVCLVIVGAVAGGSSLLSIAAEPAARPAPSSRGPFTDAQALRGKAVYAQSCAACHGAALGGGTAPALKGPAFESSWNHPQLTLDDLFYIVRTTMPPKAASSVPAADHAAVFAYLLQANGYGAGAAPVSIGADALRSRPRWAVPTAGERARANAAPDFIPGDTNAAVPAGGPDQATLNAASTSTEWLLYTHDYAGSRYSPLDQVNAANASRLAPACIFQVGETDNFQTGPLVYGGTMYITTAKSTIALDAATCKPKWKHTWEFRGYPGWMRGRGVAIKDGRLVRGTTDGYLISLNVADGTLLWARHVAKSEEGETFSMAPLVFEDLVIIGPAGSENNLQGWVGAFKLSDGSPVWRFNTVPKAGEPGYETWQNPKGIPMGGGAVWTSFSLDTATGDLYVPVTNPSPDLPVHLRKGENLYTNSIVCLDVRTGTRRWHRSLVPNDSHDWDVTHASPLITAKVKGTSRRLVATAGKDGMLRTLDRDTHDVLYESPLTTIENATAPVTTTPARVCPGVLGGVEWSDPAYLPGTNMIYTPAVDWCTTFAAFEEARYIPGHDYLGGSVDMDPPDKAQGWVTAVDASTGDVKWKYRSTRPMVASVTATAGNLLLTGELSGDFLALDARSGDVLYRFNTGGAMGGGIVTYAVQGTQYIAAISGTPSSFWVDRYGGSPTVVVFKLRP
jgi:PQQ-dependent dehydrogenase (methanol/ethanol family)